MEVYEDFSQCLIVEFGFKTFCLPYNLSVFLLALQLSKCVCLWLNGQNLFGSCQLLYFLVSCNSGVLLYCTFWEGGFLFVCLFVLK